MCTKQFLSEATRGDLSFLLLLSSFDVFTIMWAVWQPSLTVLPYRSIIKHVFPEQTPLLLTL